MLESALVPRDWKEGVSDRREGIGTRELGSTALGALCLRTGKLCPASQRPVTGPSHTFLGSFLATEGQARLRSHRNKQVKIGLGEWWRPP